MKSPLFRYISCIAAAAIPFQATLQAETIDSACESSPCRETATPSNAAQPRMVILVDQQVDPAWLSRVKTLRAHCELICLDLPRQSRDQSSVERLLADVSRCSGSASNQLLVIGDSAADRQLADQFRRARPESYTVATLPSDPHDLATLLALLDAFDWAHKLIAPARQAASPYPERHDI